MKLPILILGYERSGTTLLRRLVSMHPKMPFDIVHEQGKKLFTSETKEDAIKKLTFKSKQAGKYTGGTSSLEAGQKIPYTSFKTVKKSIDKFTHFFGDFSIIHIVRQPEGAVRSQVKTFKKKKNKCHQQYSESVPKVIEYLQSYKNVLTVSFESLLCNPLEEVRSIYEWIGDYNEDDDFLDRVTGTREPWGYNGRIMPGLRYFNSIRK